MVAASNIFTILRKSNKDELERASYTIKIDSLEKALSEYERAYDNLKIYSSSSHVLAKIALRDIYDFYDTLVVSTDHPVKKGSAVINEDGLVGIVTDSTHSTAKISLITAKNTEISVKIGESYGLLDNYLNRDKLLVVHNINNYTEIKEGTSVFTSGLQKIEGEIKVGKVVKTEIVGVERLVYVEPSVNFDDLNYLMIIDR